VSSTAEDDLERVPPLAGFCLTLVRAGESTVSRTFLRRIVFGLETRLVTGGGMKAPPGDLGDCPVLFLLDEGLLDLDPPISDDELLSGDEEPWP
jgi:hypothetical protein